MAKIELQLERLFTGDVGPTLVVDRVHCDEDPESGGHLDASSLASALRDAAGTGPHRAEELWADWMTSSCPSSRRLPTTPRWHSTTRGMLEDHERRARRDPLTGLLNHGEFHYIPGQGDRCEVDNRSGRRRSASWSSTSITSSSSTTRPATLRVTGCCARLPPRSPRSAARPTPPSGSAVTNSRCCCPAASREDCRRDRRPGRLPRSARLDGSVGASWGVSTMPDARQPRGKACVARCRREHVRAQGPHDNGAPPVLRRYDAASRLEVAAKLADAAD